jgi:RNA polymerase sigma-70 factor (ECF subfamily)
VDAARAGDPKAQEALFRRYVSYVSGLAFRLLGNDEALEDLVQESFFQALRSLQSLKTSETFPSWLGAITVRTVSKVIRNRRVLRRLGLYAGPEVDTARLVAPSAPPDAVVELTRIYRVVNDLPSALRVPLVLRRVDGATLEEIAELTVTSLSTTKRRLREAEARLDDYLTAGATAKVPS